MYKAPALTGRTYETTALSSNFDLVPNPAYAERFEGFGPEDIALAQRAYHIFHAPFASYADIENGEHEVSMADEAKAVGGVEKLARGFTVLRKLFGEEEYGGMAIVPSGDDERMDPKPYLALVNEGGLIVSRWVSLKELHDYELHFIGGKLMIKEVREVVKTSAGQAYANNHEQEIKDVTNAVDFAFSDIRCIWNMAASQQKYVDRLTGRLMELAKVQGFPHLSDADAREIADKQKVQINAWQAERPFILSTVAHGAGLVAVGQA